MLGLIYVGLLSITVLISGSASTTREDGNNGDSACKLNENATGLLCTIAKLVERARQFTANHEEKEGRDALADVEMYKEKLDYHSKLLEGLLEEAKQKGTLTEQDVNRLKSTADEAKRKNNDVHGKAHEVMKNYTHHHNRAKKSTKNAKGDTLIKGNCHSTASLLYVLQCHIEGKEHDHNEKNIDTICKGRDYSEHLTEHLGKLNDDCGGSKGKRYCSGTGTALKEALEKWDGMGTNDTTTGKRKAGNCTISSAWEKHALNARDHILELDHILETVHNASDQSFVHYSTVWQMREDIAKGKPMEEIVANARKAGQQGAEVVVEKSDSGTANETEKKSGNTTSPVEEEVKVTVQLDGLKFDEENLTANSKESFPKIYIYLLAILLPL
ncbi:unnamed protein product [Trypanosoma congolense IL3000]|uniref:WGS project CAEQ00000000 data, annotated contig 675 n=1 Tax=Trypanosoma congolense (strain IL3000) TaxID=1068625 RepID=F9WHN7_TRYCI|nr:unnamed protein product [Trypanosoma congolense IL3000]